MAFTQFMLTLISNSATVTTALKVSQMHVEVNSDICIGAGQCYLAAAAVFDTDDDYGTVVLLDAQPEGDAAEAAREAERLCPSGAIRIRTTAAEHG
ncbi:MAG TPA: ferredoxin [Jatrophihabitantaceae bacterium]|jgi:ferredoxin